MDSSHSLEEGLLTRDNSNGNRSEGAAAGSSNSGGSQTSTVNEGDNLEYLTMDNMLVRHVGEFGWGQLGHFVLVCSAWILVAMYNMVIIFSDRVPAWRCVTHSGLGVGIEPSSSGSQDQECTPSSSICEMDRDLWEWVARSAATVSEWDLICGEEYKVGLVGSLFFMGILVGGGFWGNVSDTFLGRKGTFSVALISTGILGLLTSLAPNFWAYSLMRFLTGMSCSGISQCTFVLATEVIGPTKRGSVGMSAFYFFSIGVMILPVFGYFSTSSRVLYFTISIITIAYYTLAVILLHESPRWYLVKGRVEDAMLVLRSFAKWNGNAIPDGAHLTLDDVDRSNTSVSAGNPGKEAEESLVSEELRMPQQSPTAAPITVLPATVDSNLSMQPPQSSNPKSKGTLVDVFRYKETRRRMLIMICVWFSTGLVYYGISVNVANVGFNLYVGVFVNGFIEMPALAITAALSGRLGRRAVQVGSMSLSGFFCLLGSVLFKNMQSGGVPPPAGLHLQKVLNPLANIEPHGYSHGQLSVPGGWFRTSNTSSSSPFLEAYTSEQGDQMALLRLLCGAMGLFGMAGSYNVIYMYTTELFPTVVRNSMLGVGVQAGGIGSVGGPAIAVLGRMSPSLPFVICGVLALTGAALASRLPETLDQPLWDTMEGLERAQNTRKDDE